MNNFMDRLNQSFRDKEYRHGYADEFLNMSIATQIKVLREQRGWSQKDLAEHAGMKQPRISAIENVNYYRWTVETLRRLAEAFDITLCVSFETFGKRLGDIARFGRKDLERSSFDDDPVFHNAETERPAVPVALSRANEELRAHNVVLPFLPCPAKKNAQSAEEAKTKVTGNKFEGERERMPHGNIGR